MRTIARFSLARWNIRNIWHHLYASNSMHKAFYCCFSNCFIILYGMMCLAHFTTNSCWVLCIWNESAPKKKRNPSSFTVFDYRNEKSGLHAKLSVSVVIVCIRTLLFIQRKKSNNNKKKLCMACRVQCSYQNWSSGDKNIPLIWLPIVRSLVQLTFILLVTHAVNIFPHLLRRW